MRIRILRDLRGDPPYIGIGIQTGRVADDETLRAAIIKFTPRPSPEVTTLGAHWTYHDTRHPHGDE
jgi:hypothetical protein